MFSRIIPPVDGRTFYRYNAENLQYTDNRVKYTVNPLVETGGHRLKAPSAKALEKSLGWFVEEI